MLLVALQLGRLQGLTGLKLNGNRGLLDGSIEALCSLQLLRLTARLHRRRDEPRAPAAARHQQQEQPQRWHDGLVAGGVCVCVWGGRP